LTKSPYLNVGSSMWRVHANKKAILKTDSEEVARHLFDEQVDKAEEDMMITLWHQGEMLAEFQWDNKGQTYYVKL
jgi:hypothetical protein